MMTTTHNVASLAARVARLGDGLHAALGRDVALLTAVCAKSKSVFHSKPVLEHENAYCSCEKERGNSQSSSTLRKAACHLTKSGYRQLGKRQPGGRL